MILEVLVWVLAIFAIATGAYLVYSGKDFEGGDGCVGGSCFLTVVGVVFSLVGFVMVVVVLLH